MSDENFSNARQELQDLYIGSFPEKIDTLRTQLAKLADKDNSEVRVSLGAAVHKLAGSAGSYGYARVSELARSIEQQIKEHESVDQLATQTKLLITELEKHLS